VKILVCFGTRPEAIKMAPVCYELKRLNLNFKICITAQHRGMLDQVLNYFEIKPDYDLDLMKPGQSLNNLSSLILSGIDEILTKENPDMVLVQGDTATAVMIALAAFHKGIKVGHIEAGLRTYDKTAPFPEEVNRQIISKIADLHFAPTTKAAGNLLEEKILESQVFITGNTIIDALEWGATKIKNGFYNSELRDLNNIIDPRRKLILITGHRRENFGNSLIQICHALLEISQREEVQLIFPVHLNPKVQDIVKKLLGKKDNIYLIPPVSYPGMLLLLEKCILVISDSGGIQEEAPTFRKPVLVTRMVSERMEGVEAGFSILVGSDPERIIFEADRLLDNPPSLQSAINPFGDGTASKKIVQILMNNGSYEKSVAK
jgi:UDP-N-acetylglucosamine 2-epimerase (non-hydrolysing)